MGVRLKKADLSGLSEFLHLQLEELSRLQQNWDGYGSAPLDPKFIAATHTWVDSLPEALAAGPTGPMVVPLPCGGIRFEWNDGPRSLQLEFNSINTVHYLKWNPDAGVEEEDEFPATDIKQAVCLIQWFMSGLTHA